MIDPSSEVPASSAPVTSLSPPQITAPPPPQLRCSGDAQREPLTRSLCPDAPPAVGDCGEEGLDCLYPAGECAQRFECALGVWTPLGQRCRGPEVSLLLDTPLPAEHVPDAGGAPLALADAAVIDAGDAIDAGASQGAGPPPSHLGEGCPVLAPIAGEPCGSALFICLYGATSDGPATRALSCVCGRWYETDPREVSQ